MGLASASAFDVSRPASRKQRPAYEYEAFTQAKVRVPVHRSIWVQALHKRFEDLTSLEKGWDGYNGKPVSFRVASFAASLLERLCDESVPAPSLVPGADGSVQIEWHRCGYDVEIDIRAPLDVDCYFLDIKSGEEQELQLSTDFSPLQEWVSKLREC